MRRFAALAAALAVLAGCSRVGETASGGNPWTHHGRLVYGEAYDVKSLNPMLATSAPTLDLSMLIFSYAVRYDDRERPVLDALRELPTLKNGDVSRDGLTLKYKLRDDIYFHDGVKLTCRDLAFTWHAVMNPANNDIARDGYRDIESIDCRDPYVAVVHMSHVYAPFLQQLWGVNGNAPILPEHVLAKYNDAKGSFNTAPFQSAPIGSGPFSFVRWDRGSQVVLAANDRYFLGKPKLREIVFRTIPDENTLAAEVRTHEIDMALECSTGVWPLLQHLPGTVLSANSVYTFDHVDFNLRRPLFTDVRVRRALALALDRRGMLERVSHGLGDLTDTAQSSKISYAWTKDTAHYDYDVAAARKLLDDAGWHVGGDGVRVKDGQRLAFDLSTQTESASGKAYQTVVQSAWRAVGAQASVKNSPTAQFFDNGTAGILQGGHYDTAIFAWSGAADPDDSAIYSARNLAPSGQNALFWNDALATAAMDDELATVDPKRRLKDFVIEQQRFAGQVPSIILSYRRQPEIHNSDLHGFTYSPVISPFWNPQEYSI